MVMMKMDRPDMTRCIPPRPFPTLQPTNTVDAATFDLLDGDGNGKISGDEWKRSGWTADRQKAFDGDANGDVSRTEFMDGRRFEREFNAKDRNGDGKLSRTEMMGVWLGQIGRKVPFLSDAIGAGEKLTQTAEKLTESADAKLSDAIGLKRPPSPFFPLKDRFTTFDKNQDGAVSKEEYIAGRRNESNRILKPWPPITGPIDITPTKPRPELWFKDGLIEKANDE